MKMENQNLNIPQVTVQEVVDILSLLYSDAIKKQISFKRIITPFLWGPAGVGKSQAVRQIAQEIEKRTDKKAQVIDVRLLLFNPIDLRGIPTINEDKTLAVWLKPQIFKMDENPDTVNILFLDELTAAPQSLQAAAYQICLDRKVGEHQLPDNCIVIAAGNRTTDQSVSYKMPKALCNRLMHFNVTTNYKAWLKWAMTNDIDNRIIGYLAFADNKLCVEPESSDLAYTTPRSWEHVNYLLKTIDTDIDTILPLISGCVGIDTAMEFKTWVKTHNDLPAVEDVLKGRNFKYPRTSDALLAFVSSLVSAIHSYREEISVTELENACNYINKIPTDFAMMFYTDLNSIEEIRLKLMKCSASQEWYSKNKKFI
ncbi:MAG: AAA family ATPase [Clostridia bacterium]|nr:AAA family ATPase [Clostridia bacterium]